MLFDIKGYPITVPCFVRNNNSSHAQSISKAFNKKIYTTEEEYMWIGSLPQLPYYLELVFNLPSDVGGMIVWNYNAVDDLGKGIKDVEVLLNNCLVWEGEIKAGKGVVDENYATEIVLCSNNDFLFINRPTLSSEITKSIESCFESGGRFDQRKKRVIIRAQPTKSSIELPKGQILKMRINSNWGNPSLIALTGIEIFNHNGSLIPIGNIMHNSSRKYKCNPSIRWGHKEIN